MIIRYFIGIDVSKATLDWDVFDGKTTVLLTQSANSPAAIRATVKLIKALPGFTVAEVVCCLEHTARAGPRNLLCSSFIFPLQIEATDLAGKQSSN